MMPPLGMLLDAAEFDAHSANLVEQPERRSAPQPGQPENGAAAAEQRRQPHQHQPDEDEIEERVEEGGPQHEHGRVMPDAGPKEKGCSRR